jgi:hypothetical protein
MKKGQWTERNVDPATAERATEPHPPIVWKRRKCHRPDLPYVFGDAAPIIALRADFAGQQCRRNRAGWVCPHKTYPLGSHAPDDTGVITCPLHGLRIRAADGVVLANGET